MTTSQKTTLSLAALVLTLPLGAVAQLSVGDSVGLSDAEITAKMTAEGYTIEEIEREDGELEVEVSRDGQEFEFELDPATGAILAMDVEDDDGDDEDDETDSDDT